MTVENPPDGNNAALNSVSNDVSAEALPDARASAPPPSSSSGLLKVPLTTMQRVHGGQTDKRKDTFGEITTILSKQSKEIDYVDCCTVRPDGLAYALCTKWANSKQVRLLFTLDPLGKKIEVTRLNLEYSLEDMCWAYGPIFGVGGSGLWKIDPLTGDCEHVLKRRHFTGMGRRGPRGIAAFRDEALLMADGRGTMVLKASVEDPTDLDIVAGE